MQRRVKNNLDFNISHYSHRLSKALGPHKVGENELQGPSYRFTAHPNQQVQSMATTDNFLITGTSGEIYGWDWKVVTSSKAKSKVAWMIQIPVNK